MGHSYKLQLMCPYSNATHIFNPARVKGLSRFRHSRSYHYYVYEDGLYIYLSENQNELYIQIIRV